MFFRGILNLNTCKKIIRNPICFKMYIKINLRDLILHFQASTPIKKLYLDILKKKLQTSIISNDQVSFKNGQNSL